MRLERDLLAKNDALAQRNRAWLESRGVLVLNLIGSPGAGKTALLEATIRALRSEIEIVVLEGDQATDRDAARIRAAGCPVEQINTGAGCHLDAAMVAAGLERLGPPPGSVVFIENVGNLVCPALFDLGERAKVVVMSTTEGEDKPLKYPHVFRAADSMIVTKTDLVPHLEVDLEACVAHARSVNPNLSVFFTSARSGEGIARWTEWVRGATTARRAVPA